ncbi:hypothetical protein M8J76_003594 [Diaphorina citri]|nr:hypothetical protein M8J76_003594 [Diaphorina citri]
MLGLAISISVILAVNSLPDKDKREIAGGHSKQHPPDWPSWYNNFDEYQRLTEPIFDNNTVTNMTVQLGGTAYLHCRVRNLGERTISWVRRRDWHILTSGLFTYTNDARFQVLHGEGADDWTLQIKSFFRLDPADQRLR